VDRYLKEEDNNQEFRPKEVQLSNSKVKEEIINHSNHLKIKVDKIRDKASHNNHNHHHQMEKDSNNNPQEINSHQEANHHRAEVLRVVEAVKVEEEDNSNL
jgi:hypothetical protein